LVLALVATSILNSLSSFYKGGTPSKKEILQLERREKKDSFALAYTMVMM
jgi:hypothetical protein